MKEECETDTDLMQLEALKGPAERTLEKMGQIHNYGTDSFGIRQKGKRKEPPILQKNWEASERRRQLKK